MCTTQKKMPPSGAFSCIVKRFSLKILSPLTGIGIYIKIFIFPGLIWTLGKIKKSHKHDQKITSDTLKHVYWHLFCVWARFILGCWSSRLLNPKTWTYAMNVPIVLYGDIHRISSVNRIRQHTTKTRHQFNALMYKTSHTPWLKTVLSNSGHVYRISYFLEVTGNFSILMNIPIDVNILVKSLLIVRFRWFIYQNICFQGCWSHWNRSRLAKYHIYKVNDDRGSLSFRISFHNLYKKPQGNVVNINNKWNIDRNKFHVLNQTAVIYNWKRR